MAKLTNRDAREEVEIFVSSVVPERASRALHKKGGLSVVGMDQIIVVKRLYGVVFKHRKVRAAGVFENLVPIERGSPRAQKPASGEIP